MAAGPNTMVRESSSSPAAAPPTPPREVSGKLHHGPRIIAIAGGKGGVGKSLLAANLGIFLGQLGKRTLLLDADRDGAGVHVHLGVERPTRDLRDAALLGLDEAASETPFPGLSLLAAIAAAPDGDLPPRSAQQALCSAAQALPVDYLLIDLPPGAAPLTLDLLLLAHSALVVLVPEAPAIEGAYRLLRAAFLHSLRGVVEEGAQAALEDALRTAAEHGGVSPFDLLEALGEQAELCGAVKAVLQRLRPRLVVNQTRTRADLDLGLQIRSAARRRLGLGVEYLGHLDSDDAVVHAVRKRHPLVVEHPESKITKSIERIARKLLAEGTTPVGAAPRRTEEQTLYEVLEIDPGASDEEIRRATRRMRDTYAPDSLALCGLGGAERLVTLQRRIEDAYDTLLDSERRRRYDLALFPEGVPVAAGREGREGRDDRRRPNADSGELKPTTDPKVAAVMAPAPPPLPPPEITSDTEFSGDVLQRVRQALRLELKDIATRTKIGLSQLRAIEGELWDALPAQVYLRGFLQEYAKCLRLDSAQVVRSYLERYQRARGLEPAERRN